MMRKSIRTVLVGVPLAVLGLTVGTLAAVAVSSPNEAQDERSFSEMTQEEREAQEIRTLPNGKTLGAQTIADAGSVDNLPDFIGIKYGGGKVGYSRKTDVFPDYFDPPSSPDEATERIMQQLKEGPRTIPVFADDGETVIGETTIGHGGSGGETANGTTIEYDYDKGTITKETPGGEKTVENVREGTKTTVTPDGKTTVEDLKD